MGDLGKLIVAKGCKNLQKSNKSPNLVTLVLTHSFSLQDNQGAGAPLARAQACRHLERGEDATVWDLHGYSRQVPGDLPHRWEFYMRKRVHVIPKTLFGVKRIDNFLLKPYSHPIWLLRGQQCSWHSPWRSPSNSLLTVQVSISVNSLHKQGFLSLFWSCIVIQWP